MKRIILIFVADVKGGLSVLNAFVELRGHALNVSGGFVIINSKVNS